MNYYRHGPYRPSGVSIGVPGLTPMIKKIIIVSVSVWVLQFFFAHPRIGINIDLAWGFDGYGLGVVPQRFITGALWQPLSYIFLHDPTGPMHLLWNMLMLWMFGGELERFWGPRAFLRFFLVCGIGGGIGAVLLGLLRADPTPTIGASGALFGLLVAFGTIYARRTVLFMFFFPMQARTMAAILVGLNLFYLVFGMGGGVSYIAHLAGALTAYLYLNRAWRLGEFYRELRWKIRRRKFKVMSEKDPDEWIH